MASPPARSTLWKRGGVLAGSIAVHVVLLGLMAIPALDRLGGPAEAPPAIDVTLEPFFVPAEPERRTPAAASPGRAYAPRMAARAPLAAAVAPIPAIAGAPARPGPTVGTGDGPDPRSGGGGDLRAALRASGVGCAHVEAVGLNRQERERCQERAGQAARDAPVYANVPASARAGLMFARQAVQQEIDRAYKSAPMAPGLDQKSGPPRPPDIPFVLGAEQDGLGRPMDAAHQRRKRLDDALKASR